MLDRVIYHFNDREPFTVRDACEGVQIFGGIGSGKTTGSGESLARAYLEAGFGGLVLCGKTDVLADWQRYAAETGRSKHLLVFDVSGKFVFPFLQYEIDRKGAGAGYTENLVRLFTNVYESLDRASGTKEEPYWVRSMQQLLRNAIDLCLIVTGEVSLSTIREIINSAPKDDKQIDDAKWSVNSLCSQLIRRGYSLQLDHWVKQDFYSTVTFWLSEYPGLGDKTRASIISMLTSMIDIFLRHPFRMLFCEPPQSPDTKIAYPELSHRGAVIILNIPVKEFADAGRAVQLVYKFLWQQAVERRKLEKDTLPVFLWIDEAQHFVTEYDMLFQATARSTRACTVYITQNLPNYYAEMGGEQSKHRVDSLVGNLQTKIWHANSDPATNEHAANVIGKAWQLRNSFTQNYSTDQFNLSSQQSEAFEYQVPPQFFTTLKKGGVDNRHITEAVVFRNGRIWQNQKTYLLARFKQFPHG